jgi:hypothetical protein
MSHVLQSNPLKTHMPSLKEQIKSLEKEIAKDQKAIEAKNAELAGLKQQESKLAEAGNELLAVAKKFGFTSVEAYLVAIKGDAAEGGKSEKTAEAGSVRTLKDLTDAERSEIDDVILTAKTSELAKKYNVAPSALHQLKMRKKAGK